MTGRKNILIVNDDNLFSQRLFYSLEELNANIIVAKNNRKALNCIEQENVDILTKRRRSPRLIWNEMEDQPGLSADRQG